jgi:hypothetical protein
LVKCLNAAADIKNHAMTLTVEKFSWRAAAQLTLPKEHGSWSLALEPVAFGLLVAPSAAGAALAAAAVSGFFLRRPLKLVVAGKHDSRQPLALVCATILALVGLSGLLQAVRLGAVGGWWPLLPAALVGAVFAWCDGRNGTREGAAELAGAVAFALLPAAFGALAGWPIAASLALSAMMFARSVPTVLTVRTCLRIRKGQVFSIAPALMAAGAGIFLTVWLATLQLMPWAAVAFALVFAARTCWLLLGRPRLTARTLGITEAVLGVLMVLILSFAWRGAGGW